MTAPRASRWCCRRGFPTCWSTARAASRLQHGHQHPAACNLGEVVDACLAYVDDPDVSLETLLDIVPGPDFPDRRPDHRHLPKHARTALMTRPPAPVRPCAAWPTSRIIRKDPRGDRHPLALPYQVNKAALVERITPRAELVREKRVEGGLGPARRKRPPRGCPHRHRDEARLLARRAAEPALSLHPTAERPSA